MNIVSLIERIITAATQVRAKLLKLNDYWTDSYNLTVTTSNVASGFSMGTPAAVVVGNLLRLYVPFSVTTTINANTSKKTNICKLTITDTNHILNWDYNPIRMTGVNCGTGTIITYVAHSWTGNGNGTYTCMIQLCGTGISNTTSSTGTLNPVIYCAAARNL